MADEAEAGLPANDGSPIEPGIEIDGERYELPDLWSLTLDEAELVYDISGVIQEQFAPLHPESSKEQKALHDAQNMQAISRPSFKRALVHVAYLRRHPDAKAEDLNVIIGQVNALAVSLEFLRGDQSPPAQSSPKQPESEPSSSRTSSSEASGTTSGSDSDARVVQLAPTGTGA